MFFNMSLILIWVSDFLTLYVFGTAKPEEVNTIYLRFHQENSGLQNESLSSLITVWPI
jgi:hypothetical protein